MFTYGDMNRALKLYTAAHDGKLPKAETWQDDLRSYYRKSLTPKEQLGPIPQTSPDGDWGCKEGDGSFTGMAFNTDVSGKNVNKLKDPDTVVIFETKHPSQNQHSKYERLDPNESPRVLGSPRGWLYITAGGDVITDSPRKGPQRIGNMPGGGVQVRTNVGP